MLKPSCRLFALALVTTFACDVNEEVANPGDAGLHDARSDGKGGVPGAGGFFAKGGATGTGGATARGGAGGGATGGSSGTGGGTGGSLPSSGGSGGGAPDGGDARGLEDTLGSEAAVGPDGDAGGCPPATPAQAPAGVTPLRAINAFVTRDGSTLSLCGQPFQVLGTNVYYAQSYLCYGDGDKQRVIEAFDDMVRMSLPVARIWAFYDGGSGDSATIRSAPGTYREEGLVGLDRAVSEAKKRGIRLIMTLTNYWTDYGGLPTYARWAGASGPQAFYTNTTMQGYFKDYATLLSRRTNTLTGVAYKDEPAILAWEIANELRCPTCASVDVVLSTIDSLATLLKGLFPNHLISDGGEGFDDTEANWGPLSNIYPVRGDERMSFSKIVKLASIDMASYHYYPDPWGMDLTSPATIASDAQTWIDGHAALAKAAGKVVFWGEFGFKARSPDAERAPIYDHWLSIFYGATDNGALAAFWQLISASRGMSGEDGYGVIISRDPATVAALEKYSVSRAPR